MIEINYITDKHRCRISNINDPNWDHIKLSYSEISDDFVTSTNSIDLPWHSFISSFKTLKYFIRKFNIELKINDKTLGLIKESLEKRSSYININDFEGIPENKVQNILIGKGFKRNLKAHQERNISILSRLNSGATFSVPGAGKTTEAISFYWLKRKPNQKLVVLCPKSAFPAWEEQFVECIKEKVSITRLTGGKTNISKLLRNKSDVYLISYQQFILVTDLISAFLHEKESFVFLDESHRIKGGDYSQTGQKVQSISHLPVGKLIMSGTPMPNKEMDLVPQFKFLFPEQGGITAENVTSLIQPVYVRTTKPELGLNKPKILITHIPFTEPQRRLYDLIRSEELRKAEGLNKNDKFYLRRLGRSYMRLLQISSNPSLLIGKINGFSDELRDTIEFGDSAKIEYVIFKTRKLVREGKKVLVWSGFVENVELIANRLIDLGAKYIHGGVEAGSDEEEQTREWIIKEFHDNDKCNVLVANPAACSEGISLHTVCHYAIYLDRDYNAARYLQSQDRIHRLGLPPNTETTIEILFSPDSIDERIDCRLNHKIQRMANVLNDPSINVEAEIVDLDETGFSEKDAEDLLNHLRE
ncbi:DEAD/DEAH box helicase [Winogradskyella ouciana]|uniref:ATP-dependent helicase n=1 Tax=Winogradskyella ouciana TaxID=2608631 RepID=A0A7K1GD47_9FLAO|nr:DEAD/DEAH box helicase [Winogradskyella ouciana]MTE27021.1 ATP-dependent helicase [Winogradskyella ouciana]